MMRRLLLLAALPLVTAAAPGVPLAPGVTGLPAPGVSALPPPPTLSPAPFAPPAAITPAPATNDAPSPLLTQPGPLYPTARDAGPSAPPPASSAIDQQRLQTYRSDLQSEQRSLEDRGVSPTDPRLRDIKQQLNQPGQ